MGKHWKQKHVLLMSSLDLLKKCQVPGINTIGKYYHGSSKTLKRPSHCNGYFEQNGCFEFQYFPNMLDCEESMVLLFRSLSEGGAFLVLYWFFFFSTFCGNSFHHICKSSCESNNTLMPLREGPSLLLAKVPDGIGRIGIFCL